MTDHLETLIEKARSYRERHPVTEEEMDRQARSFAFGNTHLENVAITREDIDRAADTIQKAP